MARGDEDEVATDAGVQTLWPSDELVVEADAAVVEAIAAVAPDVAEAGVAAAQREPVVTPVVEGPVLEPAMQVADGTLSESGAEGLVAEEAAPKPAERARKTAEPERLVTLPDFSAEGKTEHERHARRHVLRDASKRIEWTEAEQAMREAARIERDILLDALQDEAVATTGEGEAEAAERSAAEAAAIAAADAADAVRRADLQARLDEAEREVAAEGQRRLDAGEPLVVAETKEAVASPSGDREPEAAEAAEPAKRRGSRRKKVAAEIPVEAPLDIAAAADFPTTPTAPDFAGIERAAVSPAALGPDATRVPAAPPRGEEERILWALELRDRARTVIAASGAESMGAEMAVLSRLEQEYDVRTIAAALLRVLGAPLTPAAPPAREARDEEPPRRRSEARRAGAAQVPVAPAATAEDDGDEMTRLFISIGRRARVTGEKLQQLLTETAGIEVSTTSAGSTLLHRLSRSSRCASRWRAAS